MKKLLVSLCLVSSFSSTAFAQAFPSDLAVGFVQFLGWITAPIAVYTNWGDLKYHKMTSMSDEARIFRATGQESAALAAYLECYRSNNLTFGLSVNTDGPQAVRIATHEQLADVLIVSSAALNAKKYSRTIQVNGLGASTMDDATAEYCLTH